MSIVNWYLTPSVAFSIQKYAAAYLFVTVFIGLFSNGSIVLVTLKSQHLRGPCNILIAIQALMDIVTSLGHIVYFYFLYSRTLIPFSECYFYQFVPTSAMNITTALTLAIGVDRLLSLKYPLLYKMWSIKIYLTLMLLSCVLYDVLIKLIAYMTLTDDLVICLIADGYVGLGKDTWVFTQVIINVAVVLVYRKIQQEMAVLRNSVKEARIIILSLYTIVVAYIFGWLMTMCLLGVVRVLTTEPNLVVTCELFAGLFANLNMVIPAFIYYYRSSMYNMAFRGVFRKAEVTPLSGSHAGSTQARTSIH
ncbi:hypothetical protein QR680_012216 [Steinernema hermaphroditum]|uniref:G-protein coupled receptors family 1 profile domain-containing protein n=1 Tax=Steinernema hermaphroditum TaxID=289476 RepID=A0AA39I1A4_9BILA|nr:hypothetical protein QR680_012216 [Steinernema hermaphroditum]